MDTTLVVQKLLTPLSEATADLFKPVCFRSTDRLHISLNDTGSAFVLQAYGISDCYVCRGSGRDPELPLFRCPTCHAQNLRGNASHNAAHNWVARIPERKKLSAYGSWEVAATDFASLIIGELWDAAQLEFDKDAKQVFDYLIASFLKQVVNQKVRADFLVHKKEGDFDFIDHPKFPLTAYQRVALRTTMHEEGVALFMEQGTGKTPVVIARICNEAYKLQRDSMYRALIVAPKNVRANWANEFTRFATVPGKVTVLRGGQLNRVKLLLEAFEEEDDCAWTGIVCSYETVTRSWDALKMVEWDLAVLDESHFIKSPSAQRQKTALQDLRPRCLQRMALTGTPITNVLTDLWGQFEWLGEGLSGFRNWRNFRSYYGRFAKRNGQITLVGYENLPLIQERMSRLSFTIRKDQALPELPKKLTSIIECEMTSEQREFYRKIQTQLALEIKRELADTTKNRALVINNVLTKLLRLAQITSGYIVWDAEWNEEKGKFGEKEMERFDPNDKIEQLVELIKQTNTKEKIVVWACWVQNIKQIAARFKLEGIDCVTYYGATSDDDREEAERRFNKDDTCKVFLGNPAAGGTGLNLMGYDYETDTPGDTNCTTVVYYSQNWSPTARGQSEDRCHRKGTRVPVTYVDLVVPATIDEEIRVRVLAKRMSAYEIGDLRQILEHVLEVIDDE